MGEKLISTTKPNVKQNRVLQALEIGPADRDKIASITGLNCISVTGCLQALINKRLVMRLPRDKHFSVGGTQFFALAAIEREGKS